MDRHQKYADAVGHLDIIVPAAAGSEKVWQTNLRVFGTGSTRVSHFQKIDALARKLARDNVYDLLVTQDFAAPAGAKIKQALGLPWIVNVHGMFFDRAWLGWNLGKWYLYFRIRRAIKQADGFRVNNVTIQDILRNWGIEKPILVQPTPIDISKFQIPNDKFQTKSKVQNPIILYVGRLSAEKNVAMLIRAFQNLEQDSELWIVGAGPEEQKLKALAAGDERIKFFGAKSLNELPAYYHRADIFVLPSNTESFGQVLLQAAASGCAIVATATAGAKSILGNSEHGLLVPVGSQKALEEALSKLISTTFEREYWQKQAMALAERYDGESGIVKTVEFWKSIVGNLTRPAATPSDVGEGRVR